VRRAVDAESFSTRFTPRRLKSKWSVVNIKKSSRRYSFEEKPSQLDPKSKKRFQSNQAAWNFFRAQAPWYQRTSIYWVMDAKREETCTRRLNHLIDSSARQEPIRPLDRARVRKTD
jgi:Bacteriocin-protection, YdeI or OmpD-Associated